MRNKTLTSLIAAILAAAPCTYATKSSETMQRIDAIAAAGDTIRADHMINTFVIYGAGVTANALDAIPFTTLDKAAVLDGPDSEYSYLMHYADSVVLSANKASVSRLFPSAEEFIINGTPVTKAEFARIPAPLILTVTGEDNGKKLLVSTRNNVNDDNPDSQDVQQKEGAYFERLRTTPPSIPADSEIVLTDISSYPADCRIYVGNLLRNADTAKKLTADGIKYVGVIFYGHRPYIDINGRLSIGPASYDEVIKIPVSSLKTATLSEITALAGTPLLTVTTDGNTIYALPVSAFKSENQQ